LFDGARSARGEATPLLGHPFPAEPPPPSPGSSSSSGPLSDRVAWEHPPGLQIQDTRTALFGTTDRVGASAPLFGTHAWCRPLADGVRRAEVLSREGGTACLAPRAESLERALCRLLLQASRRLWRRWQPQPLCRTDWLREGGSQSAQELRPFGTETAREEGTSGYLLVPGRRGQGGADLRPGVHLTRPASV